MYTYRCILYEYSLYLGGRLVELEVNNIVGLLKTGTYIYIYIYAHTYIYICIYKYTYI